MPPQPARPTVVQRAGFPPGKCAVTGDIDGPFLDCGIQYENRGYFQRMYLHLPWVEQVARDHCDMVPRSEINELLERVKRAEAELEAIDLGAKAADAAEESERALLEVAS